MATLVQHRECFTSLKFRGVSTTTEDDARGWGDPDRRPSGTTHPATFLVREIAGVGRDLDRAMQAHLTVNPTDMRAMSVLLGRGPLTVSELAAALGLGPPATSMAIDRLERLGHVTRERGGPDRRRVTIRATPGSTARARSALVPMIREIDDLLDELPPADRQVIQRYLHDVVQTMRRHVGEIESAPTS